METRLKLIDDSSEQQCVHMASIGPGPEEESFLVAALKERETPMFSQ